MAHRFVGGLFSFTEKIKISFLPRITRMSLIEFLLIRVIRVIRG